MTPAEAAAFRLGLEAGAMECECQRTLEGWMNTSPATLAAAIRSLPVPETAKSAECPACRGSGLRFYCEDFDDCPECGGEGAINGPALPAPDGGEPTDAEVERVARAIIAEMSLRLAMVVELSLHLDEGDPPDLAELGEGDRRAIMQVARAALRARSPT